MELEIPPNFIIPKYEIFGIPRFWNPQIELEFQNLEFKIQIRMLKFIIPLPLFVSSKRWPISYLVLAFVTRILYSFMFKLFVCSKNWLISCLILTFITRILYSLMFRLFLCSKSWLTSWHILTFITRIFLLLHVYTMCVF